jgi:hypothetical protein
MLELISRWVEIVPPASQIVVEADERFDLAGLPQPGKWNSRVYEPATVAIYYKSDSVLGT